MTVSACDYMDYLNDALGVTADSELGAELATNEALAEVARLKRVEAAFKAQHLPKMDRLLYYVCPEPKQLDCDEDGTIDKSLFVYTTNPSEAIRLWREYYELDDEESPLGTTEAVRVSEAPIMPPMADSTWIGWDDVRSFAATLTSFKEV